MGALVHGLEGRPQGQGQKKGTRHSAGTGMAAGPHRLSSHTVMKLPVTMGRHKPALRPLSQHQPSLTDSADVNWKYLKRKNCICLNMSNCPCHFPES